MKAYIFVLWLSCMITISNAMKKTRIYFNYCCIAIVSAAITYGLMRLCQPEVYVKTVVVEKVVPAIENSVFDDELETIMLEAFLDDWGPV